MDLVLRAAVVFFFIFLITRIIGRRELSSLEPFDVILLVVIGDLVQQGVTQADESVTGSLVVIATFSVLTMAVSFVSFRFRRARTVLDGEPIVLVEDGRVIERNLRRERLSVDELLAEARQQQIGSIEELRWAVLETSGQISCIPKS
jgi:uncharacterized membrane protein YcaP (DUF421 family)